MRETATVRIFLVEGDPSSVRTAEISNWTGKAVAGPRSNLDLIMQRDEAKKPGIYFLAGINPETGRARVYIGEAEVIRSRIKSHLDRDFWTAAAFFVSKDENLTKAHVKYLEGRLIQLAEAAGRYELENTNASGSHLPESDTADMDVFLAKLEQLLPLLGMDFLRPIARIGGIGQGTAVLTCAIKGVTATGKRTENGFLVFKGSEAVLEERPSVKKYPYPSTLRSQLIADGTLVPKDTKLVFTADHEFSSPSAAASVVHGGSANGLRSWIDTAGTTLKEYEQKDVVASSSPGCTSE